MHSSGRIVDWDDVKKRLAAAQRMLADDFAPPAQVQVRILEERALALARVPQADAPGDMLEALEFSIAGERYAFEAQWVREIVVLKELTSLPCTPPFVRGVVGIRGRVVSAVDLRRFFGLPDKGIVDFHRIVVLRGRDMEFGVLVDKVEGVALLRRDDIRRAADDVPALLTEFALGAGAGRLLLDAGRLLNDARLIVDEEVR